MYHYIKTLCSALGAILKDGMSLSERMKFSMMWVGEQADRGVTPSKNTSFKRRGKG